MLHESEQHQSFSHPSAKASTTTLSGVTQMDPVKVFPPLSETRDRNQVNEKVDHFSPANHDQLTFMTALNKAPVEHSIFADLHFITLWAIQNLALPYQTHLLHFKSLFPK